MDRGEILSWLAFMLFLSPFVVAMMVIAQMMEGNPMVDPMEDKADDNQDSGCIDNQVITVDIRTGTEIGGNTQQKPEH